MRFSVLLMICYSTCLHGRRKGRQKGLGSPYKFFEKSPSALPLGNIPSDAHVCHALNQWRICHSGSSGLARVLDFV